MYSIASASCWKGSDAGILGREVRTAGMEGLGIGFLLLERECRGKHDDGNTKVVAPGEQALNGGLHIGVVGV